MNELLIASRWALFAALLVGCSPNGNSQYPDPDRPDPERPDAAPETTAACPANAEQCSAWNVRRYCATTETGGVWAIETCDGGCFAGRCSSTMCADECVLGTEGCQLWDMTSQAYVAPDPVGSMHDRARDYDRILHQHDMPEGTVMNANFTATDLSTLAYYTGFRDAAIWTGSALAAQGWRLLTTDAPDAAAQVESLTRTLHRFFTVSGAPGSLARVVVPSETPFVLNDATYCNNPEWHCNVSFGGDQVNWLGGISRDQYTGVLLGYYVAYQATADEDVRSMIRQDVVAMVRELMKERKNVPARIILNGNAIDRTLDLENVILQPAEMVDGRVVINFSSSEVGESEIAGMREFFPDFGVLAEQILGLGIPVPRASTAAMLGGMFQLALLVTADVEGMEDTRLEIADYFDRHADDWLDIASQWSFESECGKGYFANHIAFIMAHIWAMEEESGFKTRIVNGVFHGKMWLALAGHKNSYFAFLWGASRPEPPTAEITAAASQLAQFQPGPRVRVARNNTANPAYLPHDPACTSPVLTDMDTRAVDVGDRVIEDFMWQRQPWQLIDGGQPTLLYPGVDYLAAYWAGRRHSFLGDDRPGTCTRIAP